MSIFDSVAAQLTSQVTSRVQGALKGFSVQSAGAALARDVVGKFAPQASGALSKVLRGDLLGAGLDAARQTGIGQKVNALLSGSGGLLFNSMANPLLGGLTPTEAQQVIAEVHGTSYAKKNLFYIEVLPYSGGLASQESPALFNLFATNVSFGAQTLSGEKITIGSAQMDRVHVSEATDMRITTYDDTHGTIKRWFQERVGMAAHQDGTFGVMADYIVCIRILHAAINDTVFQKFGGMEQKFVMRPASIETELSRTEDGLQEIQMVFSQVDTFMFEQD